MVKSFVLCGLELVNWGYRPDNPEVVVARWTAEGDPVGLNRLVLTERRGSVVCCSIGIDHCDIGIVCLGWPFIDYVDVSRLRGKNRKPELVIVVKDFFITI